MTRLMNNNGDSAGIGNIASHMENVAGELIGVSEEGDSGYIGLNDIVIDAMTHILTALFPYHFGKQRERFYEQEKRTWELMRAFDSLTRAIKAVKPESEADSLAIEVMEALPGILELLNSDIQAAYDGDPAAMSKDEVILTYPAFKAISIFRVAHKLYEMKLPILPRMMTEYAHHLTGIDIHPGATIGRYFFIDHGTGVVIGETTTIGEHVKLYQHVTLGAKSFEADENGNPIKGIKRHPDIGNNVVIYAGATILGGRTVIGDNCIVGGNVWLTHSLPAGETITVRVNENGRETVDMKG